MARQISNDNYIHIYKNNEVNVSGIAVKKKDYQDVFEEIKNKVHRIHRIQVEPKNLPLISENLWKTLNKTILSDNPKIKFRIFGYEKFDASFLTQFKNLTEISIDVVGGDSLVSNLEELTKLKYLSSLYLKFDNIEGDLEFLKKMPQLQELCISEWKKKKNVDLSPIATLSNLRKLSIRGYNKNIDTAFKNKEKLELVALRSISSPKNIDFILEAKNIKQLIIQLGGVCDLTALPHLKKLEFLQLWNIKKLNNLDFVSSMKGLKHLYLQAINNIPSFPKISDLTKLKFIRINACRINDFSELKKSTSLVGFACDDAKFQDPKDFIPIWENQNVTHFRVFHETININDKFYALQENYEKLYDKKFFFIFSYSGNYKKDLNNLKKNIH